ncbi:MAG: peptide chain release factor N(5)-glutamine methyltransferase [Firmicutes bacterium]|nr:peptide chain release factor N(5)-glutamine methyltransferase [Bacillota bacterium]
MIATKSSAVVDMLNWATLELKGGSILNPRVEAEYIIGDAVGFSRYELYLNREYVVSPEEYDFITRAVKQRLTGRPLQYILGRQQFRYLNLMCREGVLIPRPETELLVEEALKQLRMLGGTRKVLDIGCGTGAIALSIAHEYKDSVVFATDISPEALEVAKENAKTANLSDRVRFIQSDVFSGLWDFKNEFDLVLSNPPYIPSGEIVLLQREVQFEPRLALDGGKDGLDFYRVIVKDSPRYLKPGGILMFEVGAGQATKVADLLRDTGFFAGIGVINDYQNIERIVKAQNI